MRRKKVILFLVEGITDEISLGSILSKLVENDQVHFEITNGDITSRNGVNPKNVKTKIWAHVKYFLNKKRYQKQDIREIVHLIDTDGAFVPDSAIVPTPHHKTHYTLDTIYAKDLESIARRNALKREIVDCLYPSLRIGNIPYRIYYFSRNLEHALHNQIGELTSREKNFLSEQLEDDYYGDPDAFIELLNRPEILVPGSYETTWEFIKTDLNSLHRGSNFAVFFRDEL